MNVEKKIIFFSDRNIGIISVMVGISGIIIAFLSFFGKISIFWVIMLCVIPIVIGFIICIKTYILELNDFYKKYKKLCDDYKIEKDSHDILKKEFGELSSLLDLEKRNCESLQVNVFNMMKLNIFLNKMSSTQKNDIIDKYYKEIMDIKEFERNGDVNE